MDSRCHFCRKLSEGIPAGDLVWSFPHSMAILGQWQFYEGYCVLVSRLHATELSQLPDADRRDFLDELCILAWAIEAVYHPHKLNYELLGNVVPHLHWHVFPRTLDEPDRLQPVWLAIDAAERDPVQKRKLEGSADRIRVVSALQAQLTALKAPTA